jgi:hypothetical protein
MIKWEYHTIVLTIEEADLAWDRIFEISSLGLKGWELVSVNTIPAATNEERHLERLTFKRPVGRILFGWLHTGKM